MNKIIDDYSPVNTTETKAGTTTSIYNPTYWEERMSGAQQGWQCPVCGRINAPWMPFCTCTEEQKKVTYTTDSTGNPIPNFDKTISDSDEYKKIKTVGVDLYKFNSNEDFDLNK